MKSVARWMLACVLLLSIYPASAFIRGGYTTGIAGTPVVSAASFVISSPVTNGGAVGTASCSANCAGITWSITGGNSAGNFAINSSTGAITTTASGVTDLVDLNDNFSLTVQASNGSAGSNTAAVAAYLDGSVNAPACGSNTFQNATLLSGYTHRPPWKIVGVDYCAGVDNSVTLSDPVPSGLSPTLTAMGCSGTGNITCSGSNCNNKTISGWDFSIHDNQLIISSCTNITIINNKWVNGAAQPLIVLNSSVNGATVQNNYMDSNGVGVVGQGMIECNAFGNVFIQYNYLVNAPAEQIVTGGSGSGLANDIVQYNVIRNAQQPATFHSDWDQTVTSQQTVGANRFFFNLAYQDNPAYSTQGFDIMTANGITGGQYGEASVEYNTFPTFSGNNQPNYFILISSVWLNGTSTVVGNYADPTNVGSAWMFYGNLNGSGGTGFATVLTTCTGNINMATGAALISPAGNVTRTCT